MAMCMLQKDDLVGLEMLVETDMVITGVRGLEGRLVKTQLDVMLYLAMPQLHQEVGDSQDAPSGVHVVEIWVDDDVVLRSWEDEFDWPMGGKMGTAVESTGASDVETAPSPLGDVSSLLLGPSLAAWVFPQPEATPPAPMTGTQPTESPLVGS